MSRAAESLPDVAFPGRERLVSAFDAAVALGDGHAVTAALRDAMCALIRDPSVQLPACVHTPVEGHYARRELYRSPLHGYSLVAMTWAPGQGTPIHDHDGLWCVEGIWRGALEIAQYALVEQTDDRVRFVASSSMQAGAGSAGSLIPPHEYHTIRNASHATVAVSLHVYEAPIERCARFEPVGDDWYRRTESALPADAAR
ncbi:cysteine dioxygenase family protein [Luteimonas deserti]|uniref:Cysteine dioxygenase family protein n=1 Tax=Luteimonas deserti TaxID=2752306 RepID=A0A7Z0QP34_9GAMM|nr:cysteine dioxygenase family protein [Luteimonas deserti]NYZ61262.1 cysteine dioxygenase family protein [Luteimonas deserti]